ncbi:endothiapepsin precursor, putative [Talaromyces stipitatus ATCC 10500]|uniref:Endothiapepsin, putative n=1 Tax=Talaromyces stipitatus (strain ATCC 10500 / CBS 375.48 / QM 6759 / NRRL 1006) TaxID=441959 RepID=B8LX73_TALSN|nr:endothiapepsin precursor, putative [Talaromyces stipitatus ATCC 10500]EED22723.1 endothiapepsin precursor, putative [Talaromyces stipitatus ATCC 10500]
MATMLSYCLLCTLFSIVARGAKYDRSTAVGNQSDFSSVVPLTISNWGLTGQIEIGTPAQHLDVRFDLETSAVILNSTGHYNSSASTSFTNMDQSLWMELDDGSQSELWLGNETFDIGGTNFGNVPFWQLGEFSPPRYGDSLAFNGSAGVFGLDFGSWQGLEYPSFMWTVKKYLPGEWVYTIDLYRTWNNGTCRFGSIDSSEHHGTIGWANIGWATELFQAVNLTIISAGNRTSPENVWLAFLSNDLSLVWPRDVLDWYFNGTGATWSSNDQTYRYPCNITLPDVTFGFGNGTFRIPGSYLPYQRDANSKAFDRPGNNVVLPFFYYYG